MAKGNMLLGYSRGKVGDLVFKRVKGQQVTAPRNRNPKNPKTKAQMSQRIKFASVVEFYKRGAQNLFQFAFENKGVHQSDYNAFVSANADKGIYLTPEQLKNPIFPICAPFIMSQGSLVRQMDSMYEEEIYAGVVGITEAQLTTIGSLSAALIAKGYEAGDIITVVGIKTHVDNSSEPYAPTGTSGMWSIGQFVVDPDSTTTLANANIKATYNAELDGVAFDPKDNFDLVMGCMIVSHQYADGLKVTTSQLVLNAEGRQGNTAALTPAWVEKCIDIWGASEEAILQGSLS